MNKPVRVRRLNDSEGRELQRIVRRGGKSDRSIVKWRRAMVVLASAGGNDVAVIARLVQTSPDRVREMIHRFNDLGMRSLDPQWAGGRPRQITTTDRALIVTTATTQPSALGRPFTHWSIRKLADYLASAFRMPRQPTLRTFEDARLRTLDAIVVMHQERRLDDARAAAGDAVGPAQSDSSCWKAAATKATSSPASTKPSYSCGYVP